MDIEGSNPRSSHPRGQTTTDEKTHHFETRLLHERGSNSLWWRRDDTCRIKNGLP